MKKTTGGKLNNGGYSLVELIVAVLVMAVVMGICLTLVTTSMNTYNFVNTDAVLQEESLFAMTYIENTAVEASQIAYSSVAVQDDAGTVHDCTVAAILTPGTASGTACHILLYEKDTRVLRFAKLDGVTRDPDPGDGTPRQWHSASLTAYLGSDVIPLKDGTDGSNGIADFKFEDICGSTGLGIAGNKRAMLARYISDFQISTVTGAAKLIHVELGLNFNSKSFSATKNIVGRNIK